MAMELAEVKKALTNIGLSDWEVEAYLILIRYGPQTALDLSRLSKIPRSKTYEVATRLRRKGLVMKVPPMPTKGVTQKFVAINPEDIYQTKIVEIENISKYLTEAYNNPKKARYANINSYTTKDNAKNFLLSLSKKSKYLYFHLIDSNLSYLLGYSFDNFIREMNRKKHHYILADTKEFRKLSKTLKNHSFTKEKDGINYIITSESLILDLWKTQHIILEIKSPETVKTFLSSYLKQI